MTTILNGLLGGFVVAMAAVVVLQFVRSDPSSTSTALERLAGNRVATSRLGVALAQLLYGTVAGGVLVALELYVLNILSVPPTIGEAFGVAIVWSAVLLGVAVAVGRTLLGVPEQGAHLRELLVYHLVFGVGLGVWIRMTWIT